MCALTYKTDLDWRLALKSFPDDQVTILYVFKATNVFKIIKGFFVTKKVFLNLILLIINAIP